MPPGPDLLGPLLKSVSRSFYLTLRVLPRGLREPIGLAYLLARAADTIADTAILPPEQRLDILLNLRSALTTPSALSAQHSALCPHQSNLSERKLLEALPQALELLGALSDFDRREVCRVVTTLSEGMEVDLLAFPNETSGQLAALNTRDDLERYTYLVAGCVGEFWTIMTMAHEPKLRDWHAAEMSAAGVRFGKALQYTNVLRDVPKDLRIGRCYFPEELLTKHALKPHDLLDPKNAPRARPALRELIAAALEHYDHARRYTLAIPVQCMRLRLACLWPILIGLPTLAALGRNENWLDPNHPSKISRAKVKRTLALSLPAAGSNTLLNTWIDRQIAEVKTLFELA